MTWQDVKTYQYFDLIEIQKRNDDNLNKILDSIAVLKGIDVNEITLNNYKQYAQEIAFLNTDIPIVPLKDKYGNYVLIKQIENISMKQYMDFQGYASLDDYVGVLSCFLIPENKEYNEGYDIEEVKEYINTMSVVDVITIYTFFLLQCTMYIEHFRESLKQKQQKILTKKKLERRKQMKLTQIYQLFTRYLKSFYYHTYKYLKCQLLKFFTYLIGLFRKTKKN